jgi:hypothetical protein
VDTSESDAGTTLQELVSVLDPDSFAILSNSFEDEDVDETETEPDSAEGQTANDARRF